MGLCLNDSWHRRRERSEQNVINWGRWTCEGKVAVRAAQFLFPFSKFYGRHWLLLLFLPTSPFDVEVRWNDGWSCWPQIGEPSLFPSHQDLWVRKTRRKGGMMGNCLQDVFKQLWYVQCDDSRVKGKSGNNPWFLELKYHSKVLLLNHLGSGPLGELVFLISLPCTFAAKICN